MTVLTEGQHTAEFMLSEASGFRSRAEVVLAAPAADLAAGTVLGVVTASGKYAQHDQDLVDGTEAAAAILWDNVAALDTPADTVATVIVRDAEVNGHDLIWQPDINAGELAAGIAALAAVGIIVR